jgi:hypothetical protein
MASVAEGASRGATVEAGAAATRTGLVGAAAWDGLVAAVPELSVSAT